MLMSLTVINSQNFPTVELDILRYGKLSVCNAKLQGLLIAIPLHQNNSSTLHCKYVGISGI